MSAVDRTTSQWLDDLTEAFLAAHSMRHGRKRQERMALLAEVHLAVLIGAAKAVEHRFPGAIDEARRG